LTDSALGSRSGMLAGLKYKVDKHASCLNRINRTDDRRSRACRYSQAPTSGSGIF